MSAKKRANGEGSIRKRYEGCWEGRYTAGYDILTGKRIQKGVFAKTKKECATKLAKAIQENTGPYYQRGKGYDDVTLGHWMHLWFDAYTKPNIRPNTISSYTNIIENHIIPVLGDIRLTKLQSIQIQRFYNDLKEHGRLDSKAIRTEEPLSSSMVRHAHMVLSGALKQAVKERIIPFNPCDNCRIPKKEKKEMTILPPEKIGAWAHFTKAIFLALEDSLPLAHIEDSGRDGLHGVIPFCVVLFLVSKGTIPHLFWFVIQLVVKNLCVSRCHGIYYE